MPVNNDLLLEYMFNGVPNDVYMEWLKVSAPWVMAKDDIGKLEASVRLLHWARNNKEAFAAITMHQTWREIGSLVIQSVVVLRQNPEANNEWMYYEYLLGLK